MPALKINKELHSGSSYAECYGTGIPYYGSRRP